MSTYGERIRDEMGDRGLLNSQDESNAQVEMLHRLPAAAVAAFAVAAADRLLRNVEESAGGDALARWRILVDAIWDFLAGNEARLGVVRDEVSRLDALLAEPDNYESPGLEEADLDHVAAALFAAKALVDGSAEAAATAGSRAFDAAWLRAADDIQPDGGVLDVDMAVRIEADPRVQAEMSRQRADLELLAGEGLTQNVVTRLRE